MRSLTGNDDYSIPLAYSPGYEQVFLNGVLLSRSGSEYTATNGTSITLASATVAGDIVEVICPLQIATTDTYTQSAVNNAFQANSNNFTAGKNKIINGDFSVWQRGTSVTGSGTETYSADRFLWVGDGSGGTRTFSRQTMGYGDIANYEYPYFFRFNQSVAGSGASYNYLCQRIENANTFAGQTVTFSFWAKASASTTLPAIYARQRFGSGGSSETSTTVASSIALTTSWQRFTYTFTVPSIAGKTVGTGSYLTMDVYHPINTTFTVDTFGWQLEAGSNATAFQTATGTIQGELAACQRYYYREGGQNAYQGFTQGLANGATGFQFILNLPVTMRTKPTSLDYSTLACYDGATVLGVSTLAVGGGSLQSTPSKLWIDVTATVGQTQYRPYWLITNNSTSGYLGCSAEL